MEARGEKRGVSETGLLIDVRCRLIVHSYNHAARATTAMITKPVTMAAA